MLGKELERTGGVAVGARLPSGTALSQHGVNGSGIHLLAVDTHDLERAGRDIDADQIALLDERNRAAVRRLRGHMADSRTLGSAGEAPVGDKRDGGAQLRIGGNGLGGVEHLGHAGALGALVADDHGVAGLDLVREHGVDGVFLAVERAGTQRRLEHLARHHGMLDHRALGCQVAVQDGDRAVGAKGVVERTDDVLALEAPLVQIALAALVIA